MRLTLTALFLLCATPARAFLVFQNCDADRISFLTDAVGAARVYGDFGHTYLATRAFTDQRAYGTWFGYWQSGRAETVGLKARAIDDSVWRDITFDCSVDTGICEGNVAWVHPEDAAHIIHPCDPFWTLPDAGFDSEGGTLLHELSHFLNVAGTVELKLSPDEARALAWYDPLDAIVNSTNYEYFFTTAPVLSPVPPPAPPDAPQSTMMTGPATGCAVVPAHRNNAPALTALFPVVFTAVFTTLFISLRCARRRRARRSFE